MDVLDELVVGLAIVLALWAVVVLALVLAGHRTQAGEVAAFLPNLIVLFRGLLADPRVPRRAKVALILGIAYVAAPIDLVPDFIAIAGQADDAIVAALVLRYVLRATDRAVLREHWRGEPRTLDRVLVIARV